MPGVWPATLPERPYLVVVGTSVRSLAEAGARAGYRVAAADCYGDDDTRSAAAMVALASMERESTLAAAAFSVHPWSTRRPRLVWGAGFEGAGHLLRKLQRSFRLCGNSPFVMDLPGEPRRLFELLDTLDIPHPEVTFAAPAEPRDWLLKHGAGYGGMGVFDATYTGGDGPRPDAYWQRRIPGGAFSVTFAADGGQATVMGFNTLAHGRQGPRPHVYQGAITGHALDGRQRGLVEDYVARLTRSLGLRGVNGMDFVLDGDEPLFLELNARPPASLELYDPDLPGGGAMACHVAACEGRLPVAGPVDGGVVRGHRILYAGHDMEVPAIHWPAWMKDRPAPGTRVAAGEPICSIHGDGESTTAVADVLARRATRGAALLGAAGRAAA